MIKAVIFDVDGTLVDSVDLHAKAWQDTLAEFGHALPFAKVRSQIGKGGDQLLAFLLSAKDIDEHGPDIEKRHTQILQDRYLKQVDGFADVRQLFKRLQGDGIQTVLASSAKSDELDFYKRRAGIDDLVEKETSSDDVDKSKPHPDIFDAAADRIKGVERAAMLVVGDTPYDAEAAAKAGLRTVGVLCGGFAETDLREAGCFAIYLDPADLLANYEILVRS